MPSLSSLVEHFLRLAWTSRQSATTASTSCRYSPNPRASNPSNTCSGVMVLRCCFSQTSLASEAIRWMNSVQQADSKSRVSMDTRRLGRMSLISLFNAARGMAGSSSVSDMLQTSKEPEKKPKK
ncbi:hypothetical protein RvY_19214-1 [Ramazzottius varieornatus]|uniref:Uncharacterized protein n=1 Tax=Ramazzottius varieornatus TaxID=947166 RepID=A0A1D1WBQ4_RAMVA|nr:hypothetical protein RvY_19214-1 [Ramazzottius varieornatus]